MSVFLEVILLKINTRLAGYASLQSLVSSEVIMDYRAEMERLYPENAWVTPSELCKLFYSYTISNFMLN
jgi:hypothetical protein